MLATAVLALLLQLPDTTPDIYDSPETRELVERTVSASGSIPEELLDWRRVESSTEAIRAGSGGWRGGSGFGGSGFGGRNGPVRTTTRRGDCAGEA